MNNIESYYYIIIGVGLFVMFALIGYLVELSKKNKETENNVENSVDYNPNIGIGNSVIIEDNKEELLIDKDIMNK